MDQDHTSHVQRIYLAWINTTYFLVNNGCSAHLFKALSDACSGQIPEQSLKIDILADLSRTKADPTLIIGTEQSQLTARLFGANDQDNSLASVARYVPEHDSSSSSDQIEPHTTKLSHQEIPSTSVYSERSSYTRETSVETCVDTHQDADESEVAIEQLCAVSNHFISKCASLSQYQNNNLAPEGVDPREIERTCAMPNDTDRIELRPIQSRCRSDPAVALSHTCSELAISASVRETANGSVSTERKSGTPEDIPPEQSVEKVMSNQAVETINRTISEAERALLPSTVLHILPKIAGPDILRDLRHYLSVQRSLLEGLDKDKCSALTASSDTEDNKLINHLSMFRKQSETMPHDSNFFSGVRWRHYLASIYNLYAQETTARKQTPRQRKRRTITESVKKKSLNDTFVDFLSPQLQKGGTRYSAKKRFENWRALGRICAKLIAAFGAGILVLMPRELSNETLRALTRRQETALITYLHRCMPQLKSDIHHLSIFVSHIIDNTPPPSMRFKLEKSTEIDITSGKFANASLKELFEYSEEVDLTLYLTENAIHSPSSLSSSTGSPVLLPDSRDIMISPDNWTCDTFPSTVECTAGLDSHEEVDRLIDVSFV